MPGLPHYGIRGSDNHQVIDVGMEISCYARQRTASQAELCFSHPDGSISGTIRGPFSAFSKTLPSTYRIANGQTVVVDPCYWTPELPFSYDVDLTVDTPAGPIQHRFRWGLRCCQPHRNNLYLQGKRYVVRAIGGLDSPDLNTCRELATSLVVSDGQVDDQFYRQASEQGVLLIVVTDSPSAANLRRLNQFPAVHFVARADGACVSTEHTDLLSLGPDRENAGESNSLNWIAEPDVLAAEDASQLARKPAFTWRRVDCESATELRKACDQLQATLAPVDQFAGYVVNPPF